MTITADYIISTVWELANTNPSETGGKTGSQKRAFRLLLVIRGGAGFIACRPEAELAELGRRGICSANLGKILRNMAGVELQRRQGLIDASSFEEQIRRLMRDAARSCSKNLAGTLSLSRSADVPSKRQKARSENR